MEDPNSQHSRSWMDRFLAYILRKKVIVFLPISLMIGFGILVAPFDWKIGGPLRSPVPVDAIPDIGENQQIVFTQWTGRSPQDMEDQVTYPLTAALLGIPGVKSIRSFSMFGFSSIYVIFKDKMDFYWCRSRILEKLNSLPEGTLPPGVQPALGPDATAMGQVFWYTLEGRDKNGNPTGGWDLQELRTIQDYFVRFALMAVEGVSEVASIGGFVKEYQVDLDPDRMRVNGVTLDEVLAAVQSANRDVGARTIEVNRVEYLVRGLGFIKNVEDLEKAVIKRVGQVPVFIKQVANVSLGPALRQGALDKGGAEAVGGVVVVRYGANPLEVIQAVKRKIAEIAPGMPGKQLADGKNSQVRIMPFYDRTDLIHETLGTLRTALTHEILITIVVIVIMLMHLGGSLLISGILPLAVLICFIAMKVFRVDANIVALAGIAIAIGTMVDMGIIIVENILRHLQQEDRQQNRMQLVFQATREVGSAVLTAVATTIIGFLPVFTMEAAEGKLFRPLAFTKTFALVASLATALYVIPVLMHVVLSSDIRRRRYGWLLYEGMIYAGGIVAVALDWRPGLIMVLFGAYGLALPKFSESLQRRMKPLYIIFWVVVVGTILVQHWLPLGPDKGFARNAAFVILIVGSILAGLRVFYFYYKDVLKWCLGHKAAFLSLPAALIVTGWIIWQGSDSVVGWLPNIIRSSAPAMYLGRLFPGLGKEFIPPLDEGAYLFMPTTMPHASLGEALDILQKQDMAIQTIPEVERVVGKIGRVESSLDPAPLSMIETLITYRSEYMRNSAGDLLRFRFDPQRWDFCRDAEGRALPAPDGRPYLIRGLFLRDEENRLIPDAGGHPFRRWRAAMDPALNPGRNAWKGIRSPNDIWDQIVMTARVPGTTSAAKLQPISARMVMLQSGIRAATGIRITGPDLKTIEKVALQIEDSLRKVPAVDPTTVIADRVIGKPYLEIHMDREVIAQYGVKVEDVLRVIEFAIGGKRITTTVEGRERYPVRVRYARELRDELESIGKVLVSTPEGLQIPLLQLAEIEYVRGPGVIRGENTFLAGYVIFDKRHGYSEVQAVEAARDFLEEMIEYGSLQIPSGVSYAFTGTYENQVRSEQRLMIILPVALAIILVILYLQFSSFSTTALVFSGIAVAWSGGFIMIWLYGQPWFMDFNIFGKSMRELFQVHPVYLSTAVWVGFLALFGIASDDGVVMATYLDQTFSNRKIDSTAAIRAATLEASMKRVRPCLMTTATTVLALLPVLTSDGKGADIMIPMAIPSFGGMALEVLTMLVVPVLYCSVKEFKLKRGISERYLGGTEDRGWKLGQG